MFNRSFRLGTLFTMILSNTNTPQKTRRWYDKDPGCSRLILLIKEMKQRSLQQVSGRLIKHFVEKMLNQLRGKGQPVSLGLPAIQELYMAKKNRRRWYDNDEVLIDAIGDLYSLPEHGLSALSFQLNDTLELLVIYGFACERMEAEPDINDIRDIIKTGVYDGKPEAEDLVAEIIGKDLYETLTWELQ